MHFIWYQASASSLVPSVSSSVEEKQQLAGLPRGFIKFVQPSLSGGREPDYNTREGDDISAERLMVQS